VFAGPFDLDAACAIVEADPARGDDSATAIGELVSKSLVSVIRLKSGTRYRLLDTTKTFARGKSMQSGELDAARRRHALFYLRTMKKIQGDGQSDELENLADQIEDVRSALTWAFSRRSERKLAIDLVLGSIALWEHTQLYQEASDWIEKALAKLSGSDDELEDEFTLLQAYARVVTLTTGYGAEFKAAWSRVQDVASALRQTDRQLIALFNLWAQQIRQSNMKGSLEYADLFRQLNTSPEVSLWSGVADWLEGVTYYDFGHYPEAEAPLRRASLEGRPEAVAVQQRLFHLDSRWVAMAALAGDCLMLGDAPQAIELIEKALRRCEAGSQDFAIVIVQNNAAQIYDWIGQRETSSQLAKAMLQRCEEQSLGNFTSVARALAALSDARLGTKEGVARLDAAILELQGQGSWSFVRYFSILRLGILIEMKKKGLSVPPLHIPFIEMSGNETYMAEALRLNGQLCALDGDLAGAEEAFSSALQLADKRKMRFWQLRAANNLSRLWMDAGKIDQANALLTDTLAKQVLGVDTTDIVEAQLLLKMLRARGMPTREA